MRYSQFLIACNWRLTVSHVATYTYSYSCCHIFKHLSFTTKKNNKQNCTSELLSLPVIYPSKSELRNIKCTGIDFFNVMLEKLTNIYILRCVETLAM